MTDDNHLHALARDVAGTLMSPDRKQLRFNEIVTAAGKFYPAAPEEGVRELVQSCDRGGSLYVAGQPMWASLNNRYRWMLAGDRAALAEKIEIGRVKLWEVKK